MLLSPVFASAQQQHQLFADVGLPGGLSITYEYRLTKHFGVGAGLQGYNFSPTMTNVNQFTPALYGDFRLNSIMRKKHFFFYFLDLGINFYKHENTNYYSSNYIYNVTMDNGFYTGLGLGYFHVMTKKGGGLYASLKLISNFFKANQFDLTTQKHNVSGMGYGTVALSVGFKF